jgi:multiple sugar transport system substrate-binding protein
MTGLHEGVTITVQVVDFAEEYFDHKFAGFEELTGAKIIKSIVRLDTWYQQLEADLNLEKGLVDAYMLFGNWIPSLASMGKFMELTQEVKREGLDWGDILPAIRNGVSIFNKKIYSIPIDGDVIMSLYRKDLVDDVGLPPIRNWDDVRYIANYYDGKDINGDGVPDFPICIPTAEISISHSIFWAVASSFLQTQGTSQGTFFNPDTMDPISSKPEFVEILDYYKFLVQNSHFREYPNGVDWETVAGDIDRCVLYFSYAGSIRNLISNQAQLNLTGKLSIAPLPGIACEDKSVCPFTSADGASHAPFLASGGMTYAVNGRSSDPEKKAALDFILYLSDPAVSWWDVANPDSYLDPCRYRQISALGNIQSKESQTFLDFGWEPAQVPLMKEVTLFNFLHGNYVKDLRINGALEYQQDNTMPFLLQHWSGKLTSKETADKITKSWNAITRRYGLSNQRDMYRETLGLPPYKSVVQNLAIYATLLPILIILIVLIVLVIKQRHTIKYKTRDVEAAPTSGLITIIFTDIDGSTQLWDAARGVMAKALNIHHNVIRNVIQRHNAYEVKTIGDAFMIATNSADTAVRIMNDIQMDLLEADWPIELATLPPSCIGFFTASHSQVPKPMFKGLRVRIGAHVGTHEDSLEEGGNIQVHYDKVTKGFDYYGQVVNAAARIEHIGIGGQSLISSSIYSMLSDSMKAQCHLSELGLVKLRGVSEEIQLYRCLPVELKNRKFDQYVRRLDSQDEDTLWSSDEEMILRSIHSDNDLFADISSMPLTDLQYLAKRLQSQLTRSRVRALRSSMRGSFVKSEDDDTSYSEEQTILNTVGEEDELATQIIESRIFDELNPAT